MEQKTLVMQYETFSDSKEGDELFEKTLTLFPTTGIRNNDGWTRDTTLAVEHIFDSFVRAIQAVFTLREEEVVKDVIWHDLTGA